MVPFDSIKLRPATKQPSSRQRPQKSNEIYVNSVRKYFSLVQRFASFFLFEMVAESTAVKIVIKCWESIIMRLFGRSYWVIIDWQNLERVREASIKHLWGSQKSIKNSSVQFTATAAPRVCMCIVIIVHKMCLLSLDTTWQGGCSNEELSAETKRSKAKNFFMMATIKFLFLFSPSRMWCRDETFVKCCVCSTLFKWCLKVHKNREASF